MTIFSPTSAWTDDQPQLLFEQILACVLQYHALYHHDDHTPGRIIFLPPGNILSTGILQAGGVRFLLSEETKCVIVIGYHANFRGAGFGICNAEKYFAGMGKTFSQDEKIRAFLENVPDSQYISDPSYFVDHAEHLPYLRALRSLDTCVFVVVGDQSDVSKIGILFLKILDQFPDCGIVFSGILSQGNESSLGYDNERLMCIFTHDFQGAGFSHQPLWNIFEKMVIKKQITLGGYIHSTTIRTGSQPMGYVALGVHD